MVLLKCVHWLCVEGLPLVQFKSLLELLHDLGLEDVAILKQSANIHYESYTTYNDILDCLSDLLEDELKERLSKSSVVTVLADESTDIANVKRLDIYTQIISEEMKPSTHYVTNIECTDSTGVGIANEIMSEFHKIGVSCTPVVQQKLIRVKLGPERASFKLFPSSTFEVESCERQTHL